MLFIIRTFKNFCGSANVLLEIPFKVGKKWRTFWVQHIPWSSKILFCFWIEAYFLFLNGHIRNFVLTLPNVVEIDVKNYKLLRRCLTLFNLTLKNQNLVSMLFNVVNFNVDVHNVVSMLIWRCATSQRHISLNTKLNRLWNVCCDVIKNSFEFFCEPLFWNLFFV